MKKISKSAAFALMMAGMAASSSGPMPELAEDTREHKPLKHQHLTRESKRNRRKRNKKERAEK